MKSVGAAVSVCSLPPCGGGLGRGVVRTQTPARQTATPTPNPSPQGGGERTEYAAPFSIKHKQTCSERGRTNVLSAENNRLLTQVGPGTPMGELLRRYWMPIGGASELDGNPIKAIRLMGEDLVLY